MDILRIKQELAARAQQVAEHLLPNGVKDGHEWRVGSIDGERGKSLGVHLTGTKAGVWMDFQTGEGGDLIDLWSQTRNLPLGEALKEAADWLGIPRIAHDFGPSRSFTRPPKPRCAPPRGRVRDYLMEVRNLPEAVLDLYKIGEQGDMIVFPFLLPDGDLALAKVRKAEDGAKPKPTAANCEPVLFGWQAMPPNSRVALLTEGEIDAMSWAAYGHPAMSVPFGGGGGNKQQWIENEFERMQRFERILIATDMDQPGDEAAAEIASRLGRHRCYRVRMPRKDANACLVDGIPKAEMDAAIQGAASLDPEGLRKPTEFLKEVTELFWPGDGVPLGYCTPYPKLGHRLLFRPGEVSLWSGSTGAGKSQVLSDCIVDWIKQGSRICICSLEMRAPSLLRRMIKQVSGAERPSEEYIQSGLAWMEQGLLIYDKIGKANIKSLIEVFDYSRAKYGCDQFVIDSLMRLGIASDDYTGQEKAIFELIDWAVARGIHLHVVAHARKGAAQGGVPETEDIKGASEIGANAFNVIGVWRNRQLEDEINAFEMKGLGATEEAMEKKRTPGVVLNVAKQRNGDFEAKVGLWFDQRSYRYKSSYDDDFGSREYIDKIAGIRVKELVDGE